MFGGLGFLRTNWYIQTHVPTGPGKSRNHENRRFQFNTLNFQSFQHFRLADLEKHVLRFLEVSYTF